MVGLVPTMGALHDGTPLARPEGAGQSASASIVSVFVNPAQFRAGEDYETYARPFERDAALLHEAGCDALFAPGVEEMYGGSSAGPLGKRRRGPMWRSEGSSGRLWEGEARPGHLRGVATVVAMLLNTTVPHRAYFGEKDYQQLKVIERMICATCLMGVEVVPCPTVREPDGLALSSRNANLSPEEREAAPALYRALRAASELVRRAVSVMPAELERAMREICEAEPLVALQYAAVVDAGTLSPLELLGGGPSRAIIAARVGETRLIDNIGL